MDDRDDGQDDFIATWLSHAAGDDEFDGEAVRLLADHVTGNSLDEPGLLAQLLHLPPEGPAEESHD